MTAHRGQGSASPQDGMEKGQSGRKLRRKAEQAQDNTKNQSPILASIFFGLKTICTAGTSNPQPQLMLVGGLLALFGRSCKTSPEEETNGKSSFNSTNPRHLNPEVELSTQAQVLHIK